ncbi:MAG TPA: hypothetical protein VMW27_16145 [Thermoanaerobaculia bacterium]|nr:hypothetical protein [Thermoanaerobaculia bacterium]
MARQNFQHGKRQRELAKKQKREEKLERKLHKKNNPGEDTPEESTPDAGAEDPGVPSEVEQAEP